VGSLKARYRECAALTREKSKSFYLALSFLPEPKRSSAFALYDFCRFVDDLVDERGGRPAVQVRRELEMLARMVRALEAGMAPEEPRWSALHDTVQRHRIPVGPMLELIEGVSLDLEPQVLEHTGELMNYCYLVAGVVGLMMCSALGARPEERQSAIALGIGMQLTNVLRDVAEDLSRGRVYLPANELAAYGLKRSDLERGVVTPEWRRFMAFQVERARRHYAEGDRAIACFPDDGSRLSMRLCQRVYGGILDVIERRDYDVFSRRAVVSGGGKMSIVFKTLAREWLAGRFTRPLALPGGGANP
jgi:phytoene synthase